MESERFDKILDYFPILAYLGFYVQGALIAAILTGDIRLMLLGFVTAPAVVAMILAVREIRRRHRESAGGDN